MSTKLRLSESSSEQSVVLLSIPSFLKSSAAFAYGTLQFDEIFLVSID